MRRPKRPLFGMSACLQRFQCRSQRVNLPTLREPGRPPEGHGPRRTVLSAAGSASADSASGSAGSAGQDRSQALFQPAGRAARPALWPPARRPLKVTSRARLCQGPGQLCHRRRPLSGTLTRCHDCANVASRFHLSDELEPSPGISDLLREIDRGPIAIFWGSPVQAEASTQCRYRTVPLPNQGLPSALFQGYEQFWDLMGCARSSRKPGDRDLAGVALADLPMTRPETVRPHPGLYRISDFFLNIVCELGAPLRNRTVDLLLTMEVRASAWAGPT